MHTSHGSVGLAHWPASLMAVCSCSHSGGFEEINLNCLVNPGYIGHQESPGKCRRSYNVGLTH